MKFYIYDLKHDRAICYFTNLEKADRIRIALEKQWPGQFIVKADIMVPVAA